MSSANTWRTQEWQEASAKFVKDKKCEWCGTTENLVPHHPKKKGGYTREEYLSFEGCIVLCSKCNFMENKDFKLCPNCKKKYFKPKRGREPMCFTCFSQTPFGQKVKEYYNQHPKELKKKISVYKRRRKGGRKKTRQVQEHERRVHKKKENEKR